jgi:hypothetical protein
VKSLNEVFSTLSMRRRYEVWFLRLGLADGAGAWWLRYLLMNPGRDGCSNEPQGMPVQVWATWFPREGRPQTYIQGFLRSELRLSGKARSPFHFQVGDNAMDENTCRGGLRVGGHTITWDLTCCSTFQATLSSKGWIGFSRTPHSDAIFSGRITLDDRTFEGRPVAYGVQGHNCGYRHRRFWTWAHVFFNRGDQPPTTMEALQYELPFGFVFRKAVLWHCETQHLFGNIRGNLRSTQDIFDWRFSCGDRGGLQLEAMIAGAADNTDRLNYVKTNCAGMFVVANNSLCKAELRLQRPGFDPEVLETTSGAVLESAAY